MSRDAVAVVGLGQMGIGIAASYARAGRTVLGVDPASGPEVPGMTRVDLAHAFEHAETVVLSLPGSEQVRHVLVGSGGLATTDVSGRLVIDTSTSDPSGTRELAVELSRGGHVLVDAPVSGGPAGAREGALTVFLGCPASHVDAVREQLDPIAAHVSHVGDVGAGNTAKLVNNLLVGTHLAAAREAWRIALADGLDPARLFEVVNKASGRSAVTEVNLPRWVLNEAYDSGFPVRLMARDVALAVQVAEHSGARVPLARASAQEWTRLLEITGPDADFNRMVTTT